MNEKTPDTSLPEDFPETFKYFLRHIDRRFEKIDRRFDTLENSLALKIEGVENRVCARLDRLEFLVSGHQGRIETLENQMKIVAGKLDLNFKMS